MKITIKEFQDIYKYTLDRTWSMDSAYHYTYFDFNILKNSFDQDIKYLIENHSKAEVMAMLGNSNKVERLILTALVLGVLNIISIIYFGFYF